VRFILDGGSTLFPGFVERLLRELAALVPPTVRMHVVAEQERQYLAWIGGSIVASLGNYSVQWITRAEYEE
jgi:actin